MNAEAQRMFAIMMFNMQPVAPGKYGYLDTHTDTNVTSDIYVIGGGDYTYVADVSFQHGQATVHEWRMSHMLPRDINLDVIFDFPTGAAYDLAIEKIAL